MASQNTGFLSQHMQRVRRWRRIRKLRRLSPEMITRLPRMHIGRVLQHVRIGFSIERWFVFCILDGSIITEWHRSRKGTYCPSARISQEINWSLSSGVVLWAAPSLTPKLWSMKSTKKWTSRFYPKAIHIQMYHSGSMFQPRKRWKSQKGCS